jgi:hypothetical protein
VIRRIGNRRLPGRFRSRRPVNLLFTGLWIVGRDGQPAAPHGTDNERGGNDTREDSSG